MFYKSFLIFACLFLLSTLYGMEIKDAQRDYRVGSEALIGNDFVEARACYSRLIEFLDKNPRYKPYFDFNYYQIPILRIIELREKLGEIRPELTHKIMVVYLMNTLANVPDKTLGKKTVDLTLSEEEISETQVYLGIFRVYLEVLSHGKLSIQYNIVRHNPPILQMNEFTSLDYDGKTYHSRYPELNSVDGLGTVILSSLDETDTYLFYYKSRGADPRPIGGSDYLPLIPYFKKAPMRGRLLIPFEYRNGGVLLHEFFHSLENLAGIRPGHGFLPDVRKNFPGWNGEGQYDYYWWHFDETLTNYGFDRLSFIKRYPSSQTLEDFASAVKLADEIPILGRKKAEELYQIGEQMEKKKQFALANDKYRESLKHNPYHSNSLAKLVSDAMSRKSYKEATGYIDRGLTLEPANTFHLYYQGVIHYNERRPGDAIVSMTKAIKSDPGMEKAYYYRGFLYLIQKEFLKAEADFIKASSFSEAYRKTVLDFLSKYLNSPIYHEPVEAMIQKITESIPRD